MAIFLECLELFWKGGGGVCLFVLGFLFVFFCPQSRESGTIKISDLISLLTWGKRKGSAGACDFFLVCSSVWVVLHGKAQGRRGNDTQCMTLNSIFQVLWRFYLRMHAFLYLHLSRSNALVERVVSENSFCLCMFSFPPPHLNLFFAFTLKPHEKNLTWCMPGAVNKTMKSFYIRPCCWLQRKDVSSSTSDLRKYLLSTLLFNNKFGLSWLSSGFVTGEDNFGNWVPFLLTIILWAVYTGLTIRMQSHSYKIPSHPTKLQKQLMERNLNNENKHLSNFLSLFFHGVCQVSVWCRLQWPYCVTAFGKVQLVISCSDTNSCSVLW